MKLDGVIIDYSKDGRIVAIEILDAGKRTTKGPLDLVDVTTGRAGSDEDFEAKLRRMEGVIMLGQRRKIRN